MQYQTHLNPGGWDTHIIRDRGVPTNTSRGYQWQFSYKKGGNWVTDQKKKGSLSVKLHKIWAILYFFFCSHFHCNLQNVSKFDDFTGKFWLKKRKEKVIGCKVVKGGIWWQTNGGKGVFWQQHDVYQLLGMPLFLMIHQSIQGLHSLSVSKNQSQFELLPLLLVSMRNVAFKTTFYRLLYNSGDPHFFTKRHFICPQFPNKLAFSGSIPSHFGKNFVKNLFPSPLFLRGKIHLVDPKLKAHAAHTYQSILLGIWSSSIKPSIYITFIMQMPSSVCRKYLKLIDTNHFDTICLQLVTILRLLLKHVKGVSY